MQRHAPLNVRGLFKRLRKERLHVRPKIRFGLDRHAAEVQAKPPRELGRIVRVVLVRNVRRRRGLQAERFPAVFVGVEVKFPLDRAVFQVLDALPLVLVQREVRDLPLGDFLQWRPFFHVVEPLELHAGKLLEDRAVGELDRRGVVSIFPASAVVVGPDQKRALRPAFVAQTLPHVEDAARVNVVPVCRQQDRDGGIRQRVERVAAARRGLPERIVLTRVGKLRVEFRHRFAKVPPGKIERGELEERDAPVALEVVIFLFVAAHEPAAMKPGLEETVAVQHVVTGAVLDAQHRALHVRRVGVEVKQMDR